MAKGGKQKPARPMIAAEHSLLLTIGVAREPRTMNAQLKRACGLLRRNGFAVGITSPETILLHAELVKQQHAEVWEAHQAALKQTNDPETDDPDQEIENG